MKIKLNVRVNLTKSGKIFTVWARPHAHLPGVEFYTGHGHSTREAIEDLFLNMPDEFRIDEENRSRAWLYWQSELKNRIYDRISGKKEKET